MGYFFMENILENIKESLDKVFVQSSDSVTPGIALAIIREGQNVVKACYGYSDLKESTKITADKKFYLCSLAKQFTAACLGFLTKDGSLSLEDHLIEYFPQLPENVYGEIRIKHLVHMCSGIHEWYDIIEFSGVNNRYYNWRDIIFPMLIRQQALSFQPGEKYIYCNTNYALLTLLIEKTAGMKITEFADIMIFKPLGMISTFFIEDNERLTSIAAKGYRKVDNGFQETGHIPPLLGAGGVVSSLDDMIIWLETLLQKSWEPDVIDFLTAQTHLDNGQQNQYMAGLEVVNVKDRQVIQHGGAVPGIFTYLRYYPQEGTGFIWLQNRTDRRHIKVNEMLQNILEDYHLLPESKVEKNEKGCDYSRFEGTYVNTRDLKKCLVNIVNDRLKVITTGREYSESGNNIFLDLTNKTEIIILEEYNVFKIFRSISKDSYDFYILTDNLPELEGVDDYCGKYLSNDLSAIYTISVKDDLLVIGAMKDFPGADLRYIGNEIFLSPTEGLKLRFVRDSEGSITSFYLDSFRSMNFHFRKL